MNKLLARQTLHPLLPGFYYTTWKKDGKELTQSASYRAVLDHQPV